MYSILSELTRLRNQVFHHRPVWPLKLATLRTSATEAISWISPEVQRTVLHLDRFPSVHTQDEDEFAHLVDRIINDQPPLSA